MSDPPHLTLVDSSTSSDLDAEFLPLPYYPWTKRPPHLPIEIEEAATALYLSDGVIRLAAEKLKIESLKLVRVINRSARLKRLHNELASLLNDRVHEEYIAAFKADDDRRREWASAKVSQTRQFQDHPLAPNAQGANPLAALASSPVRIVISWEDGPVIEHQPADVPGD